MADDANVKADAALEIVRLYPQGAPASEGASAGPEQTFRQIAGNGPVTEMIRNVADPTLHVYLPDPAKANGVGVIIAPGGGWRILAWRHEGVDLAHWLTERGYAAFVLRYRLLQTPPDPAAFAESMAAMARPVEDLEKRNLLVEPAVLGGRALAAADGRRAVALVRERAAEWGVEPDRVGMIGFSAGAFLTADVALDPQGADQLLFAAPIYGGGIDEGRAIPADAPPFFSAIANDDRGLIKYLMGLYTAWSKARRPAELHIFERGGHGFGMVRQGGPVDRWIDLFGDWLTDKGFC